MNFSIQFVGDFLHDQPLNSKITPAVYSTTLIALRGLQNYEVFIYQKGYCGYTNETEFEILGWYEKAQRCMVYANFLLSEGNYLDHGEWLSHPSDAGGSFFGAGSIFGFEWQAKYCDGMAEALAAQLFYFVDDLLEVFNMTNPIYLQMAEKCIGSVLIPIEQGGALVTMGNDDIWFTHHAYERRVLNGHMFVLNALDIIRPKISSTDLDSLYVRGISSLKSNIPLYLRGGVQMYDLTRPVSGVSAGLAIEDNPYYGVHSYLLYKLGLKSGDADLLAWHDRFIEAYAIDAESTPQMDVRMETSSQVEISVSIVMPSGNYLSVKQPYWIAWDDDQLQANSLELELMLWVEDGNQWDLIEPELARFRAVLGQWHEVECLGLESGRTYMITGASGRINWISVFEA